MQSWGNRARWDFRDTSSLPTKSGIVGLLGCAMGIPRNSEHLQHLEQNILMGVRADKQGSFLYDYQTISGEIATADGKTRGRKDEETTLVSHRQYLQDASFLVVLEGEEETITKCACALKKPKWAIYLGRRCCVPTSPVFEELTNNYSSIESALRNIPSQYEKKNKLLCEIECKDGDIEHYDSNITAPTRIFKQRRAKSIYVNLKEGED